jgi:hypothetical protein
MMFKVDVKVHVETGSYTITGVIPAEDIGAALRVFERALAEERGVAIAMMSPGITFFTHELLKGSLIQITPMEEE